MSAIKLQCKNALHFITVFLKWCACATLVGLLSGGIGTLFHLAVEWATGLRTAHSWIVFLLPVGGLVIVGLYQLCRQRGNKGTDAVLDAVHEKREIPLLIAPLIFVSTVITHLLGGSAGREGAALQLGGTVGSQLGKLLRADEKDAHLMVLAGMSGMFSALFGTPLTAAFFALEVVSVGELYYAGLIPCLVSALVGYWVSLQFGIAPVRYALPAVPATDPLTVLRVMGLAVGCALLAVGFCWIMKNTHRLAAKIQNEYLRIAVGGLVLVGLSLLFRSGDYNGAGMDVVARALAGAARPEAFLLKILFTAVTIGVGYKGGEIVPTFFIGATFGCVFGGLLGLDPAFGAAIGLVALFCGVVNSPIASILLSVELFGSEGILLFGIACAVSYMLSGYSGLYSSQRIIYSKTKAEFLNITAR